jgi:hypothetical protein
LPIKWPGFALRQLIDRIADSRRQVGTVEVDPQQIFVVDRSMLASLEPKALLKPLATVLSKSDCAGSAPRATGVR